MVVLELVKMGKWKDLTLTRTRLTARGLGLLCRCCSSTVLCTYQKWSIQSAPCRVRGRVSLQRCCEFVFQFTSTVTQILTHTSWRRSLDRCRSWDWLATRNLRTHTHTELITQHHGDTVIAVCLSNVTVLAGLGAAPLVSDGDGRGSRLSISCQREEDLPFVLLFLTHSIPSRRRRGRRNSGSWRPNKSTHKEWILEYYFAKDLPCFSRFN